MKKSEVLEVFQEWLEWKEKDLDREKSTFGSICIEDTKAEYRLNFEEAKEELFRASSPLEFYQELSRYFNDFVGELMLAVSGDTDLPDMTFMDDFISLFISEILADAKWEDE